jgi:hypothetical protein
MNSTYTGRKAANTFPLAAKRCQTGKRCCRSGWVFGIDIGNQQRNLSQSKYYTVFLTRIAGAGAGRSPQVLPGGEMITLRFGFTAHFAMKWNNRVYCRLSKMCCGFKDQVRARPSGETCGLVFVSAALERKA